MQPLFLCSILIFLPLCASIQKGEEDNWDDSPYLVKVLSTSANATLACTGTQITPSHVLTSAKCFKDSQNGLVLSHRGDNSSTAYSRRIMKVQLSADFAILTMKPRKLDTFCPSEIPRFTRLPLTLSLVEPSWSPVNADEIENDEHLNCRIRGFETVAVPSFHLIHSVKSVNVSLLTLSTQVMSAIVQEHGGACWDDIGLPLECELPSGGVWSQVGILSAITRNRNAEDDNQSAIPDEKPAESVSATDTKPEQDQSDVPDCKIVTGMKFSMFSDNQLPILLEKAARQDLVDTYIKCF